jgi:hypothetical protein
MPPLPLSPLIVYLSIFSIAVLREILKQDAPDCKPRPHRPGNAANRKNGTAVLILPAKYSIFTKRENAARDVEFSLIGGAHAKHL